MAFSSFNGSTLLKFARRVIVAVVGGTLVAMGIAMLILPGPAFLVIPLGLGVLAAEFAWARHLVDHVKKEGRRALGPRLSRWFRRYEEHEAKRHHLDPPRDDRREAGGG